MGYATAEEHRGPGWRADVLATKESRSVAFEVQLTAQSLARTLDRQNRYAREGVTCCWIFERPPSKLSAERPDLPLFYVSQAPEAGWNVSLSGRSELPLSRFVGELLEGGIRFSPTARTRLDQPIRLVFYEMKCWKCLAMNHIYYMEGNLTASCNAVIQPEEGLWDSTQLKYRPEIVAAARRFLTTPQGNNLHLGEVKPRHSRTVNDTYVSFGCYMCDSIFGDWFVMDAEMEAVYGYGQLGSTEQVVRFDNPIELAIPHWCYPNGGGFCNG